MLTARLLIPELSHDPEHQQPLPLREARDLQGRLADHLVPQSLYKLPVEYGLAPVQEL
jgi:hypothetical protein